MTFQPLHPHLPAAFWLGLFLTLAAGGFTAYILSGKHSFKGNMWRQVVPLWTFIICMLGLGTTIFSFWNHQKIGPIVLDGKGIETPYGKALYTDIARIYIHKEIDRSLIDPSLGRDTTKWLIIEERNGTRHALSEDQYNLPEIMQSLEGFLEENRNG
ncbi:MAG: hypothetical protein IPJ40_12880 [Saprospirales bacterium]|nr:hypothetical protein [Saprospirales bacterium]